MSKFTESSLEKKLKDLNATQQSIQTLSLWILHHKKHSNLVVQIWHREIYKSSTKKKIVLLYLANDIIQNGRKKAPEYIKEFKVVLPIAFPALIKDLNDIEISKVKRVIQVWKDRNVFDKEFLIQIQVFLDQRDTQPKKVKFSSSPTFIDEKIMNEQYDADDFDFVMNELDALDNNEKIDIPPNEEIISMLSKLENSASTDALTREKISKLPSRISDTNYLEQIQDKEELLKLEDEVDGALEMLHSYNEKLSNELEDRRKVSLVLNAYLQQQVKLIEETDEKIKHHREKLRKLNTTRLELQLHLDKLPDLNVPPPGLVSFTNEDIFSSITSDDNNNNNRDNIRKKADDSSPTITSEGRKKQFIPFFGRNDFDKNSRDKNSKATDLPPLSLSHDHKTGVVVDSISNMVLPTLFFMSPTVSEEDDDNE